MTVHLLTKFTHPLNFTSLRKHHIWYVHTFFVKPCVALSPSVAITVWHSAQTVQINLNQGLNTTLSLSDLTRERWKLGGLKASCQMSANLSVIKNNGGWILAGANLIGNGNWEDTTVRRIHLFSNLHHSNSESRGRTENKACYAWSVSSRTESKKVSYTLTECSLQPTLDTTHQWLPRQWRIWTNSPLGTSYEDVSCSIGGWRPEMWGNSWSNSDWAAVMMLSLSHPFLDRTLAFSSEERV